MVRWAVTCGRPRRGGEPGRETYRCFGDTGAPRVLLVDVKCNYGVVDTYCCSGTAAPWFDWVNVVVVVVAVEPHGTDGL